ncbi:transcription factor bHLH162 [Cajanus cajan]|uniref:Transcription factor bHLH36 n=1 Tax=Cajanus cajan TaxID=3821 RepID=A0A151SEZ9_CAJCA|nr:transcription factor bHLH162 [Cajanus cajan]KYP53375.1 Transcription factor bHLH36 [Cajanus cajan]
MDQQQGSQPSSTKVERKVVEKNRRNQMKNLYSQLYSILPTYNPKEAVPLPNQVDEAINYIKSLEKKVKTAQEKKERLLTERERTRSGFSSASEAQGSMKSAKIDIHETDSSLQVFLTCGVENQFIFCEIIRILHEENVEVISANSSMVGDSMLHVVRGEIRQSLFQIGATKVSERLKRFVYASISDVEMETDFWDFEIGSDIWELLDPTLDNCLQLEGDIDTSNI